MSGRITRSSFPSSTELRDAYNLELQSADKRSVRFGELILEKGEITTIIIFIRHFFCLYDQEYVRTVSSHLTKSVLETIPNTPGPIQLIIIGCGGPSLIVPYIGETSSSFPVYSDPDGKLYEKLHMRRTLDNIMQQPSYSQAGFWRSVGVAMKQMLWRGMGAFRGGRMDQNGGEFIFRGGKCEYAHRMENVGDHLTAEELLKILETCDGMKEVQ
ncbi:peroxiredoxin-like family protein [Aspergillus puulaauensis]|uniref:AhpC/TSA antioxidant enzyme-domain-containing protein n=1 Tax=Aspergillus puulaauensis TaxID=1220207 RepID=A0A7R7XPS0_9EURO|nr:uncharacterized protein APUU_41586S [Aspergillus puulaauensis]BCS25142.1 hypothetical protein APUU_41586S [Aspergillus puulaauensis]